MDKPTLRNMMLTKRAGLGKNFVLSSSVKIAGYINNSQPIKESDDILTYLPINNEVETHLIIDHVRSLNKRIYLPAFYNGEWVICDYKKNDELVKSYGNVFQPNKIRAVIADKIKLAFVPGVAFAIDGTRLGFGKGIYDKLLSDSTTIAIGLCYDFQIIDSIEAEVHDIKMDYLCSESGLIKII